MLNNEEKKEMLEDAKSKKRQRNFRFAKEKNIIKQPFDEYILFLNSVQEIFGPFKISADSTATKSNKL